MRKWRPHFFVYSDNLLRYYDSETSNPNNPSGKIRVIDLENNVRAQIFPDADNDRKFVVKSMQKHWELRAASAEDRQSKPFTIC